MKFADRKRYQKLRTDIGNKIRQNPEKAYMIMPETYGISDLSESFSAVVESWNVGWKFLVVTIEQEGEDPGIIVYIGLAVEAVADRAYKFIEDLRKQGEDEGVVGPMEEAAREFIRQSGAQ